MRVHDAFKELFFLSSLLLSKVEDALGRWEFLHDIHICYPLVRLAEKGKEAQEESGHLTKK